MAKVFISYRREDSQYQADRLHAALKPHVPDPERDIFIDVDNIPVGVDFVSHLEAKVAQCDVLLALIGPGWLDAKESRTGARRLDDPKDFVRIEIATALRRGIAVAPILLDGAAFPDEDALPDDLKPLIRRNGVEVRRLTFDADVQRLIRGLGLASKPAAANKRSWSGAALQSALLAAAIIGAGAVLWFADPLGWRAGPATNEASASSGEAGPGAASGGAGAPAFSPPAPGVTQAAGPCGDVEALVYFDFDRSTLSPEAMSILEDALRRTFDCVIESVTIEAHDDLGGSAEYAMGVSERRAKAVAQVFQQAGVESGAIYQQGFGHARPWRAHERSPANRRAHIKLDLSSPDAT